MEQRAAPTVNLLLEAVAPIPQLSAGEKAALLRFAHGNRKFIETKAIIGLKTDGNLLRASFEKHELPEILKDTSPEHKESVERIARTTLEAILYAYKIHRLELKDESWTENPSLHHVLRFKANTAIRDTPHILDHMLLVVSDLEAICEAQGP
jgi:hypothetical protein